MDWKGLAAPNWIDGFTIIESEFTMREPMVGSLIYGDHKVPKKSRPWKERWKLPTAVALVFIVGAVLFYKFCNYREEGAVTQFLQDVFSDHPDTAFSKWDLEIGRAHV